MNLRINPDEIEILRKALANEHGRVSSELSRLPHAGASNAAIALCRKRALIEDVLERLAAPAEVIEIPRAA